MLARCTPICSATSGASGPNDSDTHLASDQLRSPPGDRPYSPDSSPQKHDWRPDLKLHPVRFDFCRTVRDRVLLDKLCFNCRQGGRLIARSDEKIRPFFRWEIMTTIILLQIEGRLVHVTIVEPPQRAAYQKYPIDAPWGGVCSRWFR